MRIPSLMLMTVLTLSSSLEAQAARSTAPTRASTSSKLIEEFQALSEYGLLMCALAQETVDMGVGADSTVKNCIAGSRRDTKEGFVKASATLQKRPAALALLKEYYAQWLTAIDAIPPRFNEAKGAYRVRQAETTQRVKTAWNRFAIEISG